MIALGVLLFVFNVLRSLVADRRGPDNPWDGPDLEWATSSPPRPYNFPDPPVVEGRTPLWSRRDRLAVATGLSSDHRETLLTTPVEAIPTSRWALPDPGYWPLWSAIALTGLLIGSVFKEEAVVWGAIPVAIAFTAWFWPKRSEPSLGGGQ